MTAVKRASLCVLLALGVLACEDDVDPRIEQGRQAYLQYCSICHGDNAEGYAADNANALANQDFLAIASDELIRRAIDRGRPGTPMSAWGQLKGGPLDAAQIEAITVYLRSLQTVPSIDTATIAVGSGQATLAEPNYNVECLDCHGDKGAGGEFLSIANPEFLITADDGYLRQVIAKGRSGTVMPGFETSLTSQQMDDLVALIRSWQVAPDEKPVDLPSTDLGDPLVNGDGPEASFEGSDLYVGFEQVFEQYDSGARMVLLDARAPGDYVTGHIAGAVSVPFYDTGSFIDQLPKDEWIVAYCACPHAESTAAANVLLNNGFDKVKVLDEGLPAWEGAGYPMNTGPKP